MNRTNVAEYQVRQTDNGIDVAIIPEGRLFSFEQ